MANETLVKSLSDIYNELSPEQKSAAFVEKGPIRVIASAGSGKTRVLTTRYAWLKDHFSTPANRIACITFTNKAANEMLTRVKSMLGSQNAYTYICTFHSLGYKIIQQEAPKLDWPRKGFRVLSDYDIELILERIYEENSISGRIVTHKEAREYIRRQKIKCTPAYAYVSLFHFNARDNIIAMVNRAQNVREKIYYLYLLKQHDEFLLDFDDLICVPLYLFEKFPDVHDRWKKKFQYIMVDEFQDVSDLNMELCKALNWNNNLFVVGDPDQLIYSWRGAEESILLNFEANFPGAQTFLLNTNYRSYPAIITAAELLICRNTNRYPKEMIPCDALSSKESRVHYAHFQSRNEEAEYVANEILRLHDQGVSYSDIAILYRNHDTSRLFEEKLKAKNIRFSSHGQTPFYQTEEVRSVLSYLYLIDDRANSIDFERAVTSPKRGVGKKALDIIRTRSEQDRTDMYTAFKTCVEDETVKTRKIEDRKLVMNFISMIDEAREKKDHIALQNLLAMLIEKSGLQEHYQAIGDNDRLINLADLKASVREMEDNDGEQQLTLSDYLDEISTYTEKDTEENPESVKLMTVHSAKGLESKIVFIVAMNQKIFPSGKASNKKQFEEERRLAYVAITRAREELYITEAKRYTPNEESEVNDSVLIPSQFIVEAGYDDMDHVTGDLSETILQQIQDTMNSRTESETEQETYHEGDSVEHDNLGSGTIEEIDPDGTLWIRFTSDGRSRSIEPDEKLRRV